VSKYLIFENKWNNFGSKLFCKLTNYIVLDFSQMKEFGSKQIHLLKLTRLLRLARLLQKMDRYSQYSAMILTMLMLSFTIVAHWLACIWFVIAERERTRNEKEWDLGKFFFVYLFE